MKNKQVFIEALDICQDDEGHWQIGGTVLGNLKGDVMGNVGCVRGDVCGDAGNGDFTRSDFGGGSPGRRVLNCVYLRGCDHKNCRKEKTVKYNR